MRVNFRNHGRNFVSARASTTRPNSPAHLHYFSFKMQTILYGATKRAADFLYAILLLSSVKKAGGTIWSSELEYFSLFGKR